VDDRAGLLVETKTITTREPLHRELSPRSFSPVTWLNLVCLDAPLVAVTWQWCLAQNFHLALAASARIALFFTAWLVYLADRIADTFSLRTNDPKSLRQQFCQHHRRKCIVLLAVIVFLDSGVILRLDRSTLVLGIIFGMLLLGYLATNYWLGKTWRLLPVKEICVGFLFALGTIAALLPKIQDWNGFLGTFVLFATLCSLNCICIAAWERHLDEAQRKNSIATRWLWLGRYVKPVLLVFTFLCASIALSTSHAVAATACIGASALLLAALDLLRGVISTDERTALADLVLLTPLAPALLLRLVS